MFPKKRGKTVFLALIAEVNKVDHAEYVSMKLNIHISCEYMFKTFIKASYSCFMCNICLHTDQTCSAGCTNLRPTQGSLSVSNDVVFHLSQLWPLAQHQEPTGRLGMQAPPCWAFQSSSSPCASIASQYHEQGDPSPHKAAVNFAVEQPFQELLPMALF